MKEKKTAQDVIGGTGSILIFTGDQREAPQAHEVMRGPRDVMKSAVDWAQEVTVNTLRDNVNRFLKNLDAIIKMSPEEIGGLTLSEVEIHAQIDGKGNVGIAGLGGGELAVKSGIKFVLRRKA